MAPGRDRSSASTPRQKPRRDVDADGKQIGIRVPARLNTQLETIAQREGNGVSAVVRRLLTDALARETAGVA